MAIKTATVAVEMVATEMVAVETVGGTINGAVNVIAQVKAHNWRIPTRTVRHAASKAVTQIVMPPLPEALMPKWPTQTLHGHRESLVHRGNRVNPEKTASHAILMHKRSHSSRVSNKPPSLRWKPSLPSRLKTAKAADVAAVDVADAVVATVTVIGHHATT